MDIFAEVVTFPFHLCGGCPFLTGFGDSQKKFHIGDNLCKEI